LEAARVIREQICDTPKDWRDYQLGKALELERDATIAIAKAQTFERVLDRLSAATVFNRFKIWTEGPTDRPTIETIVRKHPACGRNIVAQQFGGWVNILSGSWTPDGLGDGCYDFVMLLDGDRAHDFSKADRPFKPGVARLVAKLDSIGVKYQILDRYGIENYFPVSAFAALGMTPRDGGWALDHSRPIESQVVGYDKGLNPRLADLTVADDLRGPDLWDFCETVARLSGE
jgi:hypothetical protein